MYAPPPPPQDTKKPIPWLPIILLISIGFFSVLGLCAFGGYQAYRMIASQPPTRAGYGKPQVVKYLSSGWAQYRFPEVPMTLDLPGEPKTDILDFESGSITTTKEWIYYTLDSETSSYDIVGHWYQKGTEYETEYEIDAIDDWIEASYDTHVKSSDSKPAIYGGVKGHEVWGELMRDGETIKFRAFIWEGEGPASMSVIQSYYEEWGPAPQAEFRKIMASFSPK